MVSGTGREMAERCWLDPSGFVFCLLGEVGVGLKAEATPSQLSWPALCQEGRESGTAIVCCTNARLSVSGLTGVAGRGAGWGRGYLGLRGSSQILVPMA